MKEYLFKYNDQYTLVKLSKEDAESDPEQYIEVPEGAEKATICGYYLIFWKLGYLSFSIKEEGDWVDAIKYPNRYFKFDEYMKGHSEAIIIWQRHTQPEELPFVDSLPEFKHDFGASSLNDQYAEIEQVRKQTIEATLAERQAQYGCFEDVARTTGKIMEALSEVQVNGLNDLPYPHRMALYMIASKMARIVNGDFNHKDSWHDIGGYSKLIEDLL